MKHSLKAILACTALLSPALLPAAETLGKSVRVSFAELDLRKEAGARELYSRLRRASREVCGTPRTPSQSLSRSKDECFEETLDTAVSAVGNPLLERIHRES